MNLNQFFDSSFWRGIWQANSSPWQITMAILDIAIIAFIIYRLLRVVQGTRLMILVRGVIFFIIFDVVAGLLGLNTIKWLLNQFLTYGVIALIIIFQPEIRQALERLGKSSNFFTPGRQRTHVESQIAAYEKSFSYMSKRKIGALVAIERTQTLDEYAATGIALDADISSELLINIFIPNTPLHDGAVIVQRDKIAVTSAYLPLTERTGISKQFGTRHRAAIGLSEVSDALILLVSEETGGISLALQGELLSDLTEAEFHEQLVKHLSDTPQQSGSSASLTGFVSWLRKRVD